MTKYSLLRLHLVSRKIFTYFQRGVETNLAKIQKHNTVQGYNSEENPFKIILFLCCRRILVRSTTFDSRPAARGRSWIPLGNYSLGPGVLRGPRRGPGGPLKKVKLQTKGMLCMMNSFNLPISASLSPLFTQAYFFRGPP